MTELIKIDEELVSNHPEYIIMPNLNVFSVPFEIKLKTNKQNKINGESIGNLRSDSLLERFSTAFAGNRNCESDQVTLLFRPFLAFAGRALLFPSEGNLLRICHVRKIFFPFSLTEKLMAMEKVTKTIPCKPYKGAFKSIMA